MAHSLTTAEKSGAVRAEYNSRRTAGTRALEKLGFRSYHEALDGRTFEELRKLTTSLTEEERRSFLHVTGEALRVHEAVSALCEADADRFGALLNESHASLRDLLAVSNPELDSLVEAARREGALGARLTGAGFGGFAVILCRAADRDRIATGLIEHHYRNRPGFDPQVHLIAVEPSEGALFG